jgi:hypothetical protein
LRVQSYYIFFVLTNFLCGIFLQMHIFSYFCHSFGKKGE